MRNTLRSKGFIAPLMLILVALFLCAFAVPTMAADRMSVTGNLSLGTFAQDIVHFSSGTPSFTRPDSMFAQVDLTFHNLVGPVNLCASYRQPFYGNNYWNTHFQKLFFELNAPLWKGSAFLNFERDPATGFQFGTVGYRCPFKL